MKLCPTIYNIGKRRALRPPFPKDMSESSILLLEVISKLAERGR